MNEISKSPERYTFQAKQYEDQLLFDPEDEAAKNMLEWFKTLKKEAEENEIDPEWKKDNLEYDLRSTEWILEKVRNNDVYAQNLYAAICNNSFIKNEVWPVLQEKKWSCSWRYAGGIIADMRQEGDYIDWYCSGIQKDISDEDFNALTKEQREAFDITKLYVPEAVVTDEIRNDLLRLGWVVVEE